MLQNNQFKTEHSGIKDYTLCLGNISKDFIISIMKKIGLKESVIFFPVDFNSIDNNDILNL